MTRDRKTQDGAAPGGKVSTATRLAVAVATVLIATFAGTAGASATGVSDPAAAVDAPANGANVEPATIVAELEDELMCPVCGTLLGLADAPQAHRQRAMIIRLAEEGYTKQEIKDAMVDEFGPEVLPEPEPSGFSLSAYAVPMVGLPLAAIALAIGLVRWRRQNAVDDPDSGEAAGLGTEASPEEAEAQRRLDRDLDRFDL